MGLPKSEYDVEGYSPTVTDLGEKHLPAYADESGAVPGESFTAGDSLYHKIQRFAGKYAIEQRGIERVPEDERTDKNLAKVGTMVRLVASLSTNRSFQADSFDSGLLPTWSCQVSPLEHSRSQSFSSASWTLF